MSHGVVQELAASAAARRVKCFAETFGSSFDKEASESKKHVDLAFSQHVKDRAWEQ